MGTRVLSGRSSGSNLHLAGAAMSLPLRLPTVCLYKVPKLGSVHIGHSTEVYAFGNRERSVGGFRANRRHGREEFQIWVVYIVLSFSKQGCVVLLPFKYS
jgi:hypothetical protein